VILTGGNWQPGEQVHIRVNDDAGETWRRDVDSVADGNGNVRDEFNLPNWFVATYTVTATGSSGTVTSMFTDSNPQSITVTPASRTVVQGATASYSMTMVVGGNNNPCTVTFSVTGLPAGASASFGTNPFTTIGSDLTTPLNITTSTSTPTGSFPFSVNGANSGAGCQGNGPAPGPGTLVVNAGNAAPVVDLNGAAAGIDYATTYTEDGGAVAAVDSAALTVSDVDSANIASATVTLTNRPDGSAESLAVTGGSCAGITVAAYNGSTGVLALSGSATKAAYQTCLRTLTYNNTDQDPDTNPRSITVKVNDGALDSAVATSTISITGVNDAPAIDLNGAGSGVDASASYTEDAAPTVLALGAIVTDVDDVNLIAASVQLTINPPSGTVVPDLPDEVLSWDSNPGGDCAGLTVDYNNSTGTLIINGAASVGRYQACLRSIAYENTRDAMDVRNRNAEFTVFDAHASNNTSNRPDVTVTLVPVNDTPAATDGFETMAEDGAPITIDLRTLVSDAETTDEFLTYTIVSDPAVSAGTLTGLGTIGTYSFDSADDFNGVATFTYRVTDRGDPDACAPVSTSCSDVLDSEIKTVTITVTGVNDAPVATDGSETMTEDAAPITIDLRDLVSDVETDDGFLTYSIVSDPDASAGTLTGLGTIGTYSFDSGDDFNGVATFTYKVTDRGDPDGCSPSPSCSPPLDSETKTVTITVTAVNDAPVNTVPGAQTTVEDNAKVFSSGNGNQVSVADVDVLETVGGELEVTISVTHGTLTLSGTTGLTFSVGDATADTTMTFTGTPSDVNVALNGLSYAPTPNYNGPAQLSITTDDQGNTGSGGALSDTDAVTITVAPVNDTPTAASFSVSTNEDTSVTVDLAGHVADVETSDANLTYTIVSGPAHGTLGTGGTPTYTPAADFNGTDSFTYKVTDRGDPDNCGAPSPTCDASETSTTETVTITVAPVNDAPVIDETNTKFASSTVNCGSSNAQLTVAFGDVDLADTASDQHRLTIAWGDGSPNTVIMNAVSPQTTSHTYAAPGPYVVTITARDTAGAEDVTTRNITVNFTVVGGTFKQPVNNTRNGQPLSIFKHGSTIPLKLEVTDCAGNHPSGIEIRVYWQKIDGGTPQGELEATATNFPDAGNLMRMVDSHYMFNWNTKLATDPTATIRIQATIVATGQVIYSDIGLKK